jgi:hypothetical protein
LEPFLHGSHCKRGEQRACNDHDGNRARRRRVLLAGHLQAGVLDIIYAIVYGGLSVLRGNGQLQPVYRRDSGLAIAVLIPVAWHMAGLAGYF